MSWCPLDSSYLLTCAKDNRTICWDTISGEIVAELPAGANWNFDVHWYSKIPGLISASSFDGKIGIYNIEGCGRHGLGEGGFGSESLRAPKWYNNRAGVSFGFGGKLVSFHCAESSEVYLRNIVAETGLESRSSEFKAAINNGDRSSLKVLCERKSQESESDEERETWDFMKVMFTEDGTGRSKLLAYLGFTLPVDKTISANDKHSEQVDIPTTAENMKNKDGIAENKEAMLCTTDSGEDFFNNLPSPKIDTPVSTSNDEFVSGDSLKEDQQEMNGQEESSDPSLDDAVQCALVVGDYKKAVAQCISANRLADALVIANVGGTTLWEHTRDQYLKTSRSPYLKIVSAMVNNDLMSIAKRRPLKSWKETLALFCTFAQADDWSLLCDTLAARLIAAGDTAAATLCYICAGNIDKAVEMWSKNLSKEHDSKSYIDRLQDLMEKTIVFALSTELKQFSSSLYKLVEKYAEILASQGLLTTAMEFMKLLGTAELSIELTILRDRIALLTKPDTEIENAGAYDKTQPQTEPAYIADQSSYGVMETSQTYYPHVGPSQMQSNVPITPYAENYQHSSAISFSGDYNVPPTYHSIPQQNDMAPSRFVPSPHIPAPMGQFPPPVHSQPPPNFVPSNPPLLKNLEQYQQPTLASQLYPGPANTSYQPGPAGDAYGINTSVGPSPVQTLSQVMAPTLPPRVFVPVSNPGVQRPCISSSQPPSPTHPAPIQPPVVPAAPPPTVQTVDTSKVPDHQKPVISTLTKLFNETSEALGGLRANPAKKREIEDNSRKLGALFAKLNSGDISKNAAEKLVQLCQALDKGDFGTALQIQVLLTTSDWDECNFWLSTLKRMMKTRQNLR